MHEFRLPRAGCVAALLGEYSGYSHPGLFWIKWRLGFRPLHFVCLIGIVVMRCGVSVVCVICVLCEKGGGGGSMDG